LRIIIQDFWAFFIWIFNLGADRNDNSIEARQIRTSNLFALLCILAASPPAIFNFTNDPMIDRVVMFSIAMSSIFVFYFNYLKKHNLAKSFLLGLTNILVFYLCDVQGKETGIILYYFNLIAFNFLLFKFNEWPRILVHSSFSVLLVFTLQYYDYNFLPIDHTKTAAEARIDIVYNLTIVILAFFCTLFYFSLQFRRAELSLTNNINRIKNLSTTLDAVFDINQESIWIIDESMKLVKFNDRYKAIFKLRTNFYPTEGINLNNIETYNSSKNRNLLDDYTNRWLHYYKKAFLGENFTVLDIDTHNENKLFVEASFYCLNLGKEGKKVAVFAKDITAQKNSEKKLKEYSLRLEISNLVKQKIINSENIKDLSREVINALVYKHKNSSRISIGIFELDKLIADIYYAENKTEFCINKSINNIKGSPVLENFKLNKLYFKNNLNTDSSLTQIDIDWHKQGIKSILATPIFFKDNLIGSISLFSETIDFYTNEDVLLMREIADSMATHISHMNYRSIISEKNKDISDNINYAKRIQAAVMPPEHLLKETLNDSFVFIKQKDIIGGDFYWFDKKDDMVFIAIGDCTGHGVSGSLLSVLSNNILGQAIHDKKIIDPATILDYLRTTIKVKLNQHSESDSVNDGLDISICVIDTKNNFVYFSGAMQSLYIVNKDEMQEVKGNRISIGGGITDSDKNIFCTHVIKVAKNSSIYLTTDGYIDQFSSTSNKKFGKTRFKNLLVEMQNLSNTEKKYYLDTNFENWRNKEVQTDDICMLGFKM
jgi:serine phosphatase RsbU (regulator of sigma subunit)